MDNDHETTSELEIAVRDARQVLREFELLIAAQMAAGRKPATIRLALATLASVLEQREARQ